MLGKCSATELPPQPAVGSIWRQGSSADVVSQDKALMSIELPISQEWGSGSAAWHHFPVFCTCLLVLQLSSTWWSSRRPSAEVADASTMTLHFPAFKNHEPREKKVGWQTSSRESRSAQDTARG